MALALRGTVSVAKEDTSMLAAVTSLSLLVLASTPNAGCDSCQNDRPYTPFRVEASTTSVPEPSASQPSTPSTADSAPKPAQTEGRRLEPPSGRFEFAGRQIELSKGFLAKQVLEIPSTQPDQTDALMWVAPANPDAEWDGPMGELWLSRAGADPSKVLALPAWVPSGPGCTHESRLARLGAATVLVDVHAKCDRSRPERTPNRALALLTVGKSSPPTLLLGLRIAEPATDESVTVTALASDRDGDGREDPTLQFDFEIISSKVRARAALGWLDRAAGASVDEGYLPTSLEPTFSVWEQILNKKAKLPSVLAEVAALRRLLSAVCPHSAVYRIFDWRGEALRCPAMQPMATRMASIEVRAALGLADPLEAAHALGFASTWHGGIPPVERSKLRRRIEKSLVLVTVGSPVPVTVRPVTSAEPIRFSPLRFEDDGSALLVQVDRGPPERVTFSGTSSPVDGDAGVAAWPLDVTAPDGRRWSSVVPACDRSELSLAFKGADGSLLPLVPTRLLAPRPGVCKNLAPWPIATGPISWQGDSLLAVIDGVCLSGTAGSSPCPAPDKLGQVVAGSPRSPDGRRLIVATGLGPMVLGGQKTELWTGGSLEGKKLSGCVVANDAKAIACVENQRVLLLKRPEAEPPM